MKKIKYPKTLHLPWSENLQNDDRMLESTDCFIGKEIVVLEKYDGECLEGSTILDTNKGCLSISEICENKIECSVLSFNIDNNIIEYQEVVEWSNLLGLEYIKPILSGLWDEKTIKGLWSFKSEFGESAEGYVVRNIKSFKIEDFQNNVAKFVRKNHVQTDEIWFKGEWVKNGLC